MATSTSALLKLPPELIFEINKYLPPDATLSLKLTHSSLNNTLPVLSQLKNKALSDCARFAIERHCTPPKANSSHVRCFVCKAKLPVNMFLSSSSPACISHPSEKDAAVVELPPYFCAWHVGRLVRDIQTDRGDRNEWVSSIRRMCMHNLCIQDWDDCTCDCDSCGNVMVRIYTRYRSNKAKCSQFRFWRDMTEENLDPREKIQGRLYVRECCGNSSESLLSSSKVEINIGLARNGDYKLIQAGVAHKPYVNLPVRHEDSANNESETYRAIHDISGRRHTRFSKASSVHFDKFPMVAQFFCTRPP